MWLRTPVITKFLVGAGLFCALIAVSSSADAASVEIDLLSLTYDSQTPTFASGEIEFIVRFCALDGDPGFYNMFSAQLTLARLAAGRPSAGFNLNITASEDLSTIGEDYWLDGYSSSPHASEEEGGTEFRFQDLVWASVTPTQGDVLAHYVVHFDATSDQFGWYIIEPGNMDNNYFVGNYFHTEYPNTYPPTPPPPPPPAPVHFFITPEPSTGILLSIGGVILLRRRRR